jgi:hypothetical protein
MGGLGNWGWHRIVVACRVADNPDAQPGCFKLRRFKTRRTCTSMW